MKYNTLWPVTAAVFYNNRVDIIMWLQYFGQPYLPHNYEANSAPVKKSKPSKKRKKKDSNEPQKLVVLSVRWSVCLSVCYMLSAN